MTQSDQLELVDIVLASNDGKTAGALAMAGGFSADAADKALRTQIREIGSRMAIRARDPEELQLLLDVIEAGEHDDYLNEVDAILSREAIEEGEEILAHVYGTVERARTISRSLRKPHGINAEQFERLMSVTATLCVAALVRRGQQTWLPAVGVESAASTFWSELVGAVIKGVTHVPAKRRRRRSRATYANSYKRSKKRTRQRNKSRRKTTPNLGDIFGELLKRAI